MVIAGDIFAIVFFGIYVVVLARGRVFREPDQLISPGTRGCQDNDPITTSAARWGAAPNSVLGVLAC